MRIKRIAIRTTCLGLLSLTMAAGVLAAGIASPVLRLSPCACGTVNDSVMHNLDRVDAVVQEYAASHTGHYPTHSQLAASLAREGMRSIALSPAVDIAEGTFAFAPSEPLVGTIGYAVSGDRSHYVLIGIGKSELRRELSLYGRWLGNLFAGYEYPVLHPGDTPPPHSPIE